MSTGIIAIAAALAIAISTIGPGIAMGLLESLTIYGLLIAFLLIGKLG